MFDYQMELDRSRQERERDAAARAQHALVQSPSIRRALGRSIIAIGARLAAEPQPTPRRRLARSR
jgi:hypothetical protein